MIDKLILLIDTLIEKHNKLIETFQIIFGVSIAGSWIATFIIMVIINDLVILWVPLACTFIMALIMWKLDKSSFYYDEQRHFYHMIKGNEKND